MGKMAQVEPNSGDMLPMVARSDSGSCVRRSPYNSTNLPTTPCLRRISVIVSTRSVAVVPSGNWPLSLKPTTCGISMEIGWPSMAASASMPPTPQPRMPRPLIMVVCESVPTSVSGHQLAVNLFAKHHPRQMLEVDLVNNAGIGRHDLEVVEGTLAPAQKRIALAVALEFNLVVEQQRTGLAKAVNLHGMVNDQLGRRQRVDAVGIATQLFHGFTHGGQVDNGRHAGKVL